MTPPKLLPELDDAMLLALLDWRTRHGRCWKVPLWTAWLNGTDARAPHGASLRAIRNQFGPTWLDKLRTSDLEGAATARNLAAVRN